MTLQSSNIIQVNFKKDKKAETMKHNPQQPQDFRKWFLKYRLQNGVKGCYPLSTFEKDALLEMLPQIYEQKGLNFFEFDSKTHRILIQSSQLAFFHFLFEPLISTFPLEEEEDDDGSYAVKIYFTNSPEPMIFRVDEDEPDPEDEGNKGEMDNFIFYTLNAQEGEELVHFTDEDGETVLFKPSNIAMVEIPLQVLQEEQDDLEDELQSKSLV